MEITQLGNGVVFWRRIFTECALSRTLGSCVHRNRRTPPEGMAERGSFVVEGSREFRTGFATRGRGERGRFDLSTQSLLILTETPTLLFGGRWIGPTLDVGPLFGPLGRIGPTALLGDPLDHLLPYDPD